MVSGDRYLVCVGTEKTGGDPTWLKLKWGVAIASPSLDAWTAVKNGFQVDLDYTALFSGATNTPCEHVTTGLAVHQAGLLHFGILVTEDVGTFFFTVLAAEFDLPTLDGTDDNALDLVRDRTNSQYVTTAEQLGDFVADDEVKEQLEQMRVYEAQKSQRAAEHQEGVRRKKGQRGDGHQEGE
ncbi:unnamed protein product [Laminaria digitata]